MPIKPVEAAPTPKVETLQDIAALDTYNLKNSKSAYNFITNQKRFNEK